ncbi:MAG: sugar phosphate isomerase/epimerase [Pirellulales bacterium]|nr:sugar phosphate isomerase/epimerase [Pirellulales bacterium]
MARLSMNETTTFRWSFEEDVVHYRAAGIPAIGVWRRKLSDLGEDRAVELLDQNGLAVSHLLWAGGFTGSDGRSYRDSLADAQEALATATRLKAGCLLVYSGARAGHTANHARRLFRSALDELVPQAAALGVTLAIEPMHPGCAAEWTFLTSIDETLELLAALDNPHVKMVFDTYHLGQEPAVLDRMNEIAPQVALVHLGDSKKPPEGEQNRCRLGEGTVPLGPLVAALRQAGYDGDFDVELLGEEFTADDYPSLLEHAKQAFAELVGG